MKQDKNNLSNSEELARLESLFTELQNHSRNVWLSLSSNNQSKEELENFFNCGYLISESFVYKSILNHLI